MAKSTPPPTIPENLPFPSTPASIIESAGRVQKEISEHHPAQDADHADHAETNAAREEADVVVPRQVNDVRDSQRQLLSITEAAHATELDSANQEGWQAVEAYRAELERSRRRIAMLESEVRVATSELQTAREKFRSRPKQLNVPPVDKETPPREEQAAFSRQSANMPDSLDSARCLPLAAVLQETAEFDAAYASFEEQQSAAELTRTKTNLRLQLLQSESDARIQAREQAALIAHQQRQTARYIQLSKIQEQALALDEHSVLGMQGTAQGHAAPGYQSPQIEQLQRYVIPSYNRFPLTHTGIAKPSVSRVSSP